MSLSLSSESPTVREATPNLEAQPVQMRTGGGVASYLAKVWAVAAKDLRAELRAKEVLGIMGTFSVLAVLIFGMAFDLRVPQAEMIVPGVLWVVVLFTGVLGLNRSFAVEVDRGSLAALLLAPVDRSALYFGKLLANLVFTLLAEVLIVPVILILFDVNLFQPLVLLALLLGTIGYGAVGTLFAAMAANTRTRESLLPVLLLPVMVPVFMAGIKLTAVVVDGRGLSDIGRWLGMLIAYDVVFLTVAFLVFDLIWEEA
jgi:heme exporter protein B